MNLGDILERLGYQVACSDDGESGLEHAKRVQPDLIFMDVKMPGLDGFQICERLRAQENFQQIPIILMSSQSVSANRDIAFGAGSSDFWPKPISPGKILNELPRFSQSNSTYVASSAKSHSKNQSAPFLNPSF